MKLYKLIINSNFENNWYRVDMNTYSVISPFPRMDCDDLGDTYFKNYEDADKARRVCREIMRETSDMELPLIYILEIDCEVKK